MVWLELNQMVDVLGIAEQVLVGIFCMAVMEVTLGTAADRKTRIWKWVCVILSTALIYQLIAFGSGVLVLHVLASREGSWQDDVLLSLVFNGIYLFCNTLRRLLPMAMSYAGGIWLYRQGRSAKAFAL